MDGYTDKDRNKFVEEALINGRHAEIIKIKLANELQTVKYLRDLADKIENGACHIDESSVSINKLSKQHSLEVIMTDAN
ncbi:hypothetical protein [Pseudoalteromonas fuliginea]|uniref:Uncharacterized protein n=1 Tax=Pseudoalteromonas fuliginea TaxID=1872678 RepID=A0ABQ6RK98_9GAMM|nr:hypothetical protein [Pseudoalteromonas fuliginea]KAA1160325.1 hypothetical protein EU509_06050 [Pseudoalteromonas fuliginea]KAA1168743.1 hypothetical protein EUZ79_04055 [Pseudoalteromonas fuliginea]